MENQENYTAPEEQKTPEKKESKWSLPVIISVISLGMSVVLLVLLLARTSGVSSGNSVVSPASGNGARVAFINTDTILSQYLLVKDYENQLKEKTQKFEREMAGKEAQFRQDAEYFDKSVKSNSLSEQSAQEIYQKLMARQSELVQQRDGYRQELAAEDLRINVLLIDTVTNFLKRYNKKLGYDYIIGVNKAGNVFHAETKYDLTAEVVNELNKEFTESQKAKK
jgi:outer membrane protein